MGIEEDMRLGRSIDRPVHVGEGNMYFIGPAFTFEEDRRTAARTESAPRGIAASEWLIRYVVCSRIGNSAR